MAHNTNIPFGNSVVPQQAGVVKIQPTYQQRGNAVNPYANSQHPKVHMETQYNSYNMKMNAGNDPSIYVRNHDSGRLSSYTTELHDPLFRQKSETSITSGISYASDSSVPSTGRISPPPHVVLRNKPSAFQYQQADYPRNTTSDTQSLNSPGIPRLSRHSSTLSQSESEYMDSYRSRLPSQSEDATIDDSAYLARISNYHQQSIHDQRRNQPPNQAATILNKKQYMLQQSRQLLGEGSAMGLVDNSATNRLNASKNVQSDYSPSFSFNPNLSRFNISPPRSISPPRYYSHYKDTSSNQSIQQSQYQVNPSNGSPNSTIQSAGMIVSGSSLSPGNRLKKQSQYSTSQPYNHSNKVSSTSQPIYHLEDSFVNRSFDTTNKLSNNQYSQHSQVKPVTNDYSVNPSYATGSFTIENTLTNQLNTGPLPNLSIRPSTEYSYQEVSSSPFDIFSPNVPVSPSSISNIAQESVESILNGSSSGNSPEEFNPFLGGLNISRNNTMSRIVESTPKESIYDTNNTLKAPPGFSKNPMGSNMNNQSSQYYGRNVDSGIESITDSLSHVAVNRKNSDF